MTTVDRRRRVRSTTAGPLSSLLLAGVLAFGWAAPAAADSMAAAAVRAPASAPDPLAPVRALIGDAACSGDEQCHTIAVGAKACGGPEAYLAWSTQRTEEKALEAAAAAYSSRRLDIVARGGRVSNCALTVDPGASCQPAGAARSCQLRRAGSKPVR
jgi:hypothetical protein